MMERIAKFDKVSYEQFNADFRKIYNTDYDKELFDKLPLPTRSTICSAGYDFRSPFAFVLEPNKTVTIPLGIRCCIEPSYVLMIFDRSSLGFKYGIMLSNGTGIIDSDYYFAENEGHIMLKLINLGNKPVEIDRWDKICQGIFLPYGITQDDSVSTLRIGGIGSTGTK